MSEWVFWQSELSAHQSAQLRALAELPGQAVTLVSEQGVPADRVALGWHEPELGAVRVVKAPGGAEVSDLVARAGPKSLHVFSGIPSRGIKRVAFRAVVRAGATAGVMSESNDPRGWKGLARRLRGAVQALALADRIAFVLAIGESGMRWYSHCGFPDARIYRHAYFTESQPEPARSPRGSDEALELVFVGSLIPRKGVDLLLSALSGTVARPWRLSVVGDGPERRALARQAVTLGISDRISWLGVLPNRETSRVVGSSDLLVLPSRFDGWGAVVNEALMQGVPAICSSACGAADLLGAPERGGVFKVGDVGALRAALEARMEQGPVGDAERVRLRGWSAAIRGDSAARYLVQVLDSVQGRGLRPVPPWMSGR